jgi:hypothetical protein
VPGFLPALRTFAGFAAGPFLPFAEPPFVGIGVLPAISTRSRTIEQQIDRRCDRFDVAVFLGQRYCR